MSLYMFRALNAHLQEVTLYTCIIWYSLQSDSTICCMYTVYPPEDEHFRLETCRGT
jgi:hypothetical protein